MLKDYAIRSYSKEKIKRGEEAKIDESKAKSLSECHEQNKTQNKSNKKDDS